MDETLAEYLCWKDCQDKEKYRAEAREILKRVGIGAAVVSTKFSKITPQQMAHLEKEVMLRTLLD